MSYIPPGDWFYTTGGADDTGCSGTMKITFDAKGAVSGTVPARSADTGLVDAPFNGNVVGGNSLVFITLEPPCVYNSYEIVPDGPDPATATYAFLKGWRRDLTGEHPWLAMISVVA
ncbi:MAG: hypothetical protein JO103_14960 [Candidatus Eremiobacteraeota bacterium]|nr:hypothetical protein [Candidatus Eremiobacteraeota bacterium]MBV9407926.1 hypothetical protein [Candidatus Eremiobacteraeota bacterium]